MNSAVSKPRRRSEMKLSKSLQETLLGTMASIAAGIHVYISDSENWSAHDTAGTELSPQHEEQARKRLATRRSKRSGACEESPIDTDGHTTAWS
jgi:hypothetical protein